VFTPAETALAGVLRGGASLRCHSILTILQYTGQAAGFFLLAPAAYFFGGAELTFVVSAVLFAVVIVQAIPIVRSTEIGLPDTGAARLQGIIQGARFIARSAPARDAVFVLAIKGIVARGVLVAIPVILAQGAAGRPEVAVFMALGAAGTAVGLLWGGTADSRKAGMLQRSAMVGIGVAAVGFALLDVGIDAAMTSARFHYLASPPTLHAVPLAALGICAFVFGLSLALALIGAKTVLTQTPGPALQGRVAAAHHLLIDAALVMPMLLAGAAATWVGPRPMIAGLGMVALALAAWLHRGMLLGWLRIGQKAIADAVPPAPAQD
jgi:hypothetical protein